MNSDRAPARYIDVITATQVISMVTGFICLLAIVAFLVTGFAAIHPIIAVLVGVSSGVFYTMAKMIRWSST